jgi:hypothetical protein
VSADGGDQPVWDRRGNGLYFVTPDGRLFRTVVRLTGTTADVGESVMLGLPRFGERHWGTTYDVGPDGFVHFPMATTDAAPRELHVVLGWQQLIAAAGPR